METIDLLRNIWYLLIGVLLAGYAILDGFDLGIGTLMPFLAKSEKDKRYLYNSIGPFWDGNEVWLLTGGGALFAAFPHAYATVFSGFYLALMLVLFALIFRAVSLEYWHHSTENKKLWEWTFIIGSFLPALLFGVALGNVVVGVPLDNHMEFTGSFFTLLRPFPLIIGLLGLVAILQHGLTYAILKTEGDLQKRARSLLNTIWLAFIVLFLLSFVAAIIWLPFAIKSILGWVFAVVALIAWFLIKYYAKAEQDGKAFFMSSLLFAALWGIVGAVHFPNLVRAIDEANSITVANGSSSQLTLTVMLIIAIIGMPLVIFYTAYIYRAFKGKVVLDEEGY